MGLKAHATSAALVGLGGGSLVDEESGEDFVAGEVGGPAAIACCAMRSATAKNAKGQTAEAACNIRSIQFFRRLRGGLRA